MVWKVAQAKQQLSQLIRAAAAEPQRIFRRDRLVAAVVDGPTFEAFEAWREGRERRSIAECFAALRALCAEEGFAFPAVEREDRPNAFVAALTEQDASEEEVGDEVADRAAV
jgi:hypothetical protein